MNVVPLHEHKKKALRPPVNLIGQRRILSEVLLRRLGADYDIRPFSPQQILDQTASEQERMMQEAVATLIDWDERSPLVLSILRAVARRNAVPLVVLCGPNRAEQVAALVVGGYVCLTYPFNPILIQARLLAYRRLISPKSVLLEARGDGLADGRTVVVSPVGVPPPSEAHEVLRVGAMTLDRTARRFFVFGNLVELTPKEFDLMDYLMDRVGICRTRDEILNQVWGVDYEAETNVLGVLMYGLRRKLASCGLEEAVRTVRGVGYRLVGPGA